MQSPNAIMTPHDFRVAVQNSIATRWDEAIANIDSSSPAPFAPYLNPKPPTPVRILGAFDSARDFDEVLKTYVSCLGNKFYREEVLLDEAQFFLGKLREQGDVMFVKYYTVSRKGPESLCALAILERIPKFSTVEPAAEPVEVAHQWLNWRIIYMALDPSGADNFTYFLGQDTHAARAVVPPGSPPSRYVVLKPTPAEPCVEYKVFFMNKLRYHIHDVTVNPEPVFIYNAATRSRFMDAAGLRAILGPIADDVENLESMIPKTHCGASKSTRKVLENIELDNLRLAVVEHSCPAHFFRLYKIWLESLLTLPIDLHPVEYQTYGRRFLMSPEELVSWDECSFLLVLGARAEALSKSPVEASLFYGNGAYTFVEVSPHDNHWACKTEDGGKLGDLSDEWILDTLDHVVVKEDAFFKKLEGLSNDPDTVDAAFQLLTEDTITPKFGQNLLGLSESLLIRLARHEIIFHPDLMSMIKATLADYGDWVLPLPSLEFDTRLRPASDLLFKIGEFRVPAVSQPVESD